MHVSVFIVLIHYELSETMLILQRVQFNVNFLSVSFMTQSPMYGQIPTNFGYGGNLHVNTTVIFFYKLIIISSDQLHFFFLNGP